MCVGGGGAYIRTHMYNHDLFYAHLQMIREAAAEEEADRGEMLPVLAQHGLYIIGCVMVCVMGVDRSGLFPRGVGGRGGGRFGCVCDLHPPHTYPHPHTHTHSSHPTPALTSRPATDQGWCGAATSSSGSVEVLVAMVNSRMSG